MLHHLKKILLFGICPAAFVLGSWTLSDYAYRPGIDSAVVTNLLTVEDVPGIAVDRLANNADRATLILFFHPHCPCTAATIRALERMSVQFARQPKIVAFAFCPGSEPCSWVSSSTTTGLRNLNAIIVVDKEGRYCSRFGVRTSGHILVYNQQGSLLFSGGITPGRGHEGDCAAATDLLCKVNKYSGSTQHWPVYGCPIVVQEGTGL